MKIPVLTAILCFLLGLLTLSFVPQVKDPFCDLQQLCPSNDPCKEVAHGLNRLQAANTTATPAVTTSSTLPSKAETDIFQFKSQKDAFFRLQDEEISKTDGLYKHYKSKVSMIEQSTVSDIQNYRKLQNKIVFVLNQSFNDPVTFTFGYDLMPEFPFEDTYQHFEPENVSLYVRIKNNLVRTMNGRLVLELINQKLQVIFKMSNLCASKYQTVLKGLDDRIRIEQIVTTKDVEMEDILKQGKPGTTNKMNKEGKKFRKALSQIYDLLFGRNH